MTDDTATGAVMWLLAAVVIGLAAVVAALAGAVYLIGRALFGLAGIAAGDVGGARVEGRRRRQVARIELETTAALFELARRSRRGR